MTTKNAPGRQSKRRPGVYERTRPNGQKQKNMDKELMKMGISLILMVPLIVLIFIGILHEKQNSKHPKLKIAVIMALITTTCTIMALITD